MMSRTNRCFPFFLAVILALTLAGCGGGNSKPKPPPPPPPAPMTVDMSSVSADADKEAGTLEIAAGASKTLGEVTYRCAAGGDGCTVTVKDDGTATYTGGRVTAADSAGYTAEVAAAVAAKAKADADAAAEQAKAAEAEEKLAAEANKVYPALLELGMDGNSDLTLRGLYSRPGGTQSGTPPYKVAEVLVKHGQPLPLQALLSDRALDFKSVLGSPVERNGRWAVTEVAAFTDPQTGHTYRLRFLNDIEPPEMITVRKKYGADGENILRDATRNPTFRVDLIDLPEDVGTRLQSAGLPAVSEPRREIEANDNGNVSLRGTFDGIPGKLLCVGGGSNCEVTNAKGGARTLSNGWRFQPDNWEQKVPGEPDESYITFGWWLRTGVGTAEAETYALGSGLKLKNYKSWDAFRRQNLHQIGGRASYEGPAIGVYALQPAPGTGRPSWGSFTAKAAFEVDFGGVGDKDAEGSYGPVTGTITEFTSGGESLPWRVDLTVGDQANNMGNDKPSVEGDAVWSINDVKTSDKKSQWQANFYASKQDYNDTLGEAPDSLAGKFSVKYGTYGQMDGAFGAYIKE